MNSKDIFTELITTIQNINIESDKVQKLELFIFLGKNDVGRGSTCIHIILPCDDKVCEENSKLI